jgi:hypothetical protein
MKCWNFMKFRQTKKFMKFHEIFHQNPSKIYQLLRNNFMKFHESVHENWRIFSWKKIIMKFHKLIMKFHEIFMKVFMNLFMKFHEIIHQFLEWFFARMLLLVSLLFRVRFWINRNIIAITQVFVVYHLSTYCSGQATYGDDFWIGFIDNHPPTNNGKRDMQLCVTTRSVTPINVTANYLGTVIERVIDVDNPTEVQFVLFPR